ncbi:proline dehydrogenase family protein [Bdellovibrionales bacterium]|nr:proline dehydrogenase family protein [Bdellovibrionales bacterium]
MELDPTTTEPGSYRQGKVSMKSQYKSASSQTKIEERGLDIFKKMENQSASIFNKDWWYGRILDWSMKNEQFKTQMFRFVDVLPYLKSGSEVARHLKEYFAEGGEELPPIFNLGIGVGSLAPGLMAGAIKKNVTQMAKMFITGETPKEALPVLRKSRKSDLTFTVDLLGEATLSEKEALEYQSRYLDLIDSLLKDSTKWPDNPLLDSDDKGAIPKINISVKASALYSQMSAKDWDNSLRIVKERLRPIFKVARENFVFINIDMESYHHKELTLKIFKELIMEPEFRDYPHWGVVIQAYLRDSFEDVQALTLFAKERGTPFTIRLVKGAYWDFETIHSDQQRWEVPVYTNKAESDWNFERSARFILDNHNDIRVALGSHNVRSIAAAMTYAEELGLPKNALEVQMLYGMAEPIKKTLVQEGYRVREYATVGELIPGMAYLVRRLLENTSNESFLRSKFADDVDPKILLQDPEKIMEISSSAPPERERQFYNAALLDFSKAKYRAEFSSTLESVQATLGQTSPLIIGGKEVTTGDIMERENPSHPKQIVGRFHLASPIEGELALKEARTAFKSWKLVPTEERAQLIDRLADLMERDRQRLAALEIFESGKPWSEADGDITEAMDFCRYYARHMRELAQRNRVGGVTGEVSLHSYHPRGVTLVIAPWNFPLAILTGMVSAAVVTGNTVVMKPAEQSSLIAYELMKLLMEAGCPDGVVNYVPGRGEDVGEYLTGHSEVDTITFTGSKKVGLQILEKSGKVQGGQIHPKKCIIEMGGKNGLIIDNDADLDEAVAGVIYSAFGFQGQKCSACSRAIVVNEIYDRFLERLVEATRSIPVSYAEDPKAYMGPVVDREAFDKINSLIEKGKKEAQLIYQGEVPSEGHFIPPTIFADVAPTARIAQDEIFGPVLAVIRAKDIDEAIEIANATEYGLTGGAYSRSPRNIEKVKQGLEVGNLYINRSITGAMVERHPFGGLKMSGVGAKTGGADYIKQFMYEKVVTENTMRRGFAPTEES